MKHIQIVTKVTPAAAFIDHPDLVSSILAFIAEPIETIQSHLKKEVEVGGRI